MKNILLTITIALTSSFLYSQDINPLVLSEETSYYNFWEGTWYKVNNETGIVDTSVACFKVTKGIHPACWKEEWHCIKATALRSWDKTNNRWM